MANDETKPGFWGWAQKHWFLTFLLAGSALSLPVSLVSAAKGTPAPTPGAPPVPPANPNAGPNAPFKPGDVVVIDKQKIQGAISVGTVLPGDPTTGTFNARIDSLDAPNPGIGLDPNSFMGTVVAPVVSTVSVPLPRNAVVGVVSRS